MKDITTINSHDVVMAPALDELSLLPSVQHACQLSQPVVCPDPACGDLCFNSSPPTVKTAEISPSLTFASLPLMSFYPSSPSSAANFIASPSAPFNTSPAASANFAPSPSSDTFTLSPATPYTSEVSPSTSLHSPLPAESVKSEGPLMSTSMSPQSEVQPRIQPGSLGSKRTASPLSPSAAAHVKKERAISPGMTVSGNLLPPCRICLDKASGFHYGLNTCEACKGFFRRSLKRGASYVCTRDGKCDVTGERRNLCGFCRYQKCITLGMSKTAIKTGRYTHAKRTRDTLEIKKLMRADSSLNEEEEINFDEVIAQIVKVHDDFVISSTKIPMDRIQQKQQQKLDETKLHNQLFGQMGVSPDQHKEFLSLTGMEIDNRGELMAFHIKNSERWIRGYISFAKHVPGFKELSLSDQANLVKYARIEFWFLGAFPGYSSELGLAVMPNGRCFTREEMYTVWQHKYIDVAFDLSDRFKKLKVTPEEMILIKTICLTAGDRCSFQEPEKVARIQWRMVRCLQYLLQRNHSSHTDFVTTFSNVFMCLADLRDLNEAEYQTIQNTELYEKFSGSPLMMEVLPY